MKILFVDLAWIIFYARHFKALKTSAINTRWKLMRNEFEHLQKTSLSSSSIVLILGGGGGAEGREYVACPQVFSLVVDSYNFQPPSD